MRGCAESRSAPPDCGQPALPGGSQPQDARPPLSGLLTNIAGARLVEEQTHRDVPACRPAHSRVAGLCAPQGIPGEASIGFLDNRHSTIPLEDRRAGLSLQGACHVDAKAPVCTSGRSRSGSTISTAPQGTHC